MTILAHVADPTANTNDLIYTMTASLVVNILIVNRTANSIGVSLGIVKSGSSIGTDSWIEFQKQLDGHEPLERGGIPLDNGDAIYVNPSATGVTVNVVGLA